MVYTINVALNKQHYFSTSKHSITTEEKAREIATDLAARFTEAEGFSITICEWREVGKSVDFTPAPVVPPVKPTYEVKEHKEEKTSQTVFLCVPSGAMGDFYESEKARAHDLGGRYLRAIRKTNKQGKVARKGGFVFNSFASAERFAA